MCHNAFIEMRFFGILLTLGLVLGTGFFLLSREKVAEIVPVLFKAGPALRQSSGQANAGSVILEVPEAESLKEALPEATSTPKSNGDIESQSQLTNPPEMAKAIYATGWSAGSAKKIDSLIKMIDETELNAIVIDIKDYSGFISYSIDNPLIKSSGALNELRIVKPNSLIKKLHDKNIYVIGRISVFQDPILAKAHPEWAIKSGVGGEVWRDRKGLAWMDPASREVWDYNISITKDALARGFDEINFDYIRFPSDGDLGAMTYPFWNKDVLMADVIGDFFKYIRSSLPQAKISADLFGLVTTARDDMGIGQMLEKALPYFDYIMPMVYPSHYAVGAMGFKNPADHPYEIVNNAVAEATKRLVEYNTSQLGDLSSSTVTIHPRSTAKIRPWLQDFDLGAVYTSEMIRSQIKASDEAGGTGWALWDPKNIYTKKALLDEPASQ